MTKPLSVRLQPEVNDQLTALAASMDRSKSWVIEQAVKEYLALEAWRVAAIKAAIKEADEGRLVPHEDVADWIRSLGTDNVLTRPK